MSSGTGIEWTDASWQVTSGCTKVSDGCKHCYAETMAHRLRAMAEIDVAHGRDPKGKRPYLEVIDGNGHWSNRVVPVESNLSIPLKWRKPRMIFVNSMSDLFHEAVPFEFIDKVFAVMALCPQHVFQVLTKRPGRMADYMSCKRERVGSTRAAVVNCAIHKYGGLPADGWPFTRSTPMDWPLPNVWIGTSCENQQAADERIPHLLKCPAAVRFLSCEPLIGPIDLRFPQPSGEWITLEDGSQAFDTSGPLIDWVIVGGESGPNARPCDVQSVRDIAEQCKASGVACFVKQLGSVPAIEPSEMDAWDNYPNFKHSTLPGGMIRIVLCDSKGGDPSEWPADLRVREMPQTKAAVNA